MVKNILSFLLLTGLMSVATEAGAAPANKYNDRSFNDRVNASNTGQSGAGQYNDRVNPQRFDNWASRGSTNTRLDGGKQPSKAPPEPLDASKKLSIKTHITDPKELEKKAVKPKPPKRQVTYRPWDAYNPKETLPPPPKPTRQ